MNGKYAHKDKRVSGDSCVKVNLCFHSWRHASKPLLTHMLETLTQASEKLICFRSVSRTAHAAEEKLSALSSYTFLCLPRRPWRAQAKLTSAVSGGSSEDIRGIQNWKLLHLQVWLHERHIVSLCRKLQSETPKQNHYGPEKNMHLSIYCREFWLFESIVSHTTDCYHAYVTLECQCKKNTSGFKCDYFSDFVLKAVISCSLSCSFITLG